MSSSSSGFVSLDNSDWRPGLFNRFYFIASYVADPIRKKKNKILKQCDGCCKEMCVQSIQVMFVREICTPKFPARKRKIYHPQCVPTWMVLSVNLYSQTQQESHQKGCYRDGDLAEEDKWKWKEALGSNPAPDSPHHRRKRKRQQQSDEDYEPGLSDEAKSKKRFAGACRNAVSGLITTFKEEYFRQHGREDNRIKCPLSNRWLTANEVHIDHEYPQTFDRLVNEFVRSVKPSHMSFHQFIVSVEFVYGQFFDSRLSASFFDFHQKNAKLRVLSAKRNLKLPKVRIDETASNSDTTSEERSDD